MKKTQNVNKENKKTAYNNQWTNTHLDQCWENETYKENEEKGH